MNGQQPRHGFMYRRRSKEQTDGFEEFVATAGDALFRLAVVLSADVRAGEDLYQATLERVARRWDTIDHPAAWSRRVMHNLSVDRYRARRSRPAEVAAHDDGWSLPDAGSADRLEAVEVRPVLLRALADLSDAQRLVVALRFLEDRSESDVADLLGVPVGTVKSTASRAVSRLRRHPSIARLHPAHDSSRGEATG